MYEYIKGDIVDFGLDYLVIECNNIGYHIHSSQHTIASLMENKENVSVFTKLIVKEDDMSLCGFSSRRELEVFKLLISVSGIGVKVALGMLSAFHFDELLSIIQTENVNMLTKAPGIGKKTAQRAVLELKDKVAKHFDEVLVPNVTLVTHEVSDAMSDAINALVALEYRHTDVKKALSAFSGDIDNVEEIIKFGLLQLSVL
ncbi:MAG: Holliday junction branch migration protein RuvA [Clostridia bacterium]|nr:Holliday junction branch migration protein RuvA [Clostridia bacterium]